MVKVKELAASLSIPMQSPHQSKVPLPVTEKVEAVAISEIGKGERPPLLRSLTADRIQGPSSRRCPTRVSRKVSMTEATADREKQAATADSEEQNEGSYCTIL